MTRTRSSVDIASSRADSPPASRCTASTSAPLNPAVRAASCVRAEGRKRTARTRPGFLKSAFTLSAGSVAGPRWERSSSFGSAASRAPSTW